MSKLIARVRSHNRGQLTSGRNTLALLVECIEHFFGPSGDWSPLAELIGGSQPAQSQQCRRLTGAVVHGWTVRKDEEQTSGLRFVKKKNANQGVNLERLNEIRALVEAGASIQSTDVKNLFREEPVVKSTDEILQESAARYVKRMMKEGVNFSAIVAAVQAAAEKEKIDPQVKGLVAAL